MYIIQFVIFVCVISIGVKSKYGSCNGNCTGFIILKKKNNYRDTNLCVVNIFSIISKTIAINLV